MLMKSNPYNTLFETYLRKNRIYWRFLSSGKNNLENSKIKKKKKILFSFVVFSGNFNKKSLYYYFAIRGGSLKKIEKKIIPNVPINKKV